MAQTETDMRGDPTPRLDTEDLAAKLAALREEVMAAAERLGRQLELDRRMRESPMAVLGVAAGAGFVLGGGVWPVIRPFLRAMIRGALSPSNLVALAAALGAMRVAQGEESRAGGETSTPTQH